MSAFLPISSKNSVSGWPRYLWCIQETCVSGLRSPQSHPGKAQAQPQLPHHWSEV